MRSARSRAIPPSSPSGRQAFPRSSRSPPTSTCRSSRERSGPAAGATDGALRRDARAEQERRRARRAPGATVAAAVPDARLVDRRQGRAARRRRASAGRLPELRRPPPGARAGRRRAADGRVDVPRAALALRGARPRADRELRARPRCRRQPRRRDPRRRPRRRRGPARRPVRRRGHRAGADRGPLGPRAWPSGSVPRRTSATATGTRRPTTTQPASAPSSTGPWPRRGADVRLVFVTQTIDAEDPNLAIAVDWVRALAARCDEVRVVADRVRAHDLPENVSFARVRRRLAPRPRRPVRARRSRTRCARHAPTPCSCT